MIAATLGGKLQLFLMSSYLYYECNTQVISDTEFDEICTALLVDWNNFDHVHKYLVGPEDLLASTGYAIRNYPRMVKSAALAWKAANNR